MKALSPRRRHEGRRGTLRACATDAFLVLLLFPCAGLSQSGGLGASPGSVFSPSGRLADSTRDLRASQLDDIVTILVTESASAVASGVTNTSRKSSAKNGITSLAGTLVAGSPLA